MGDEEPEVSAELNKMEHEPLLPVEKKLIVGSLLIGIVLLGLLIWISNNVLPTLKTWELRNVFDEFWCKSP